MKACASCDVGPALADGFCRLCRFRQLLTEITATVREADSLTTDPELATVFGRFIKRLEDEL